MKKLSFLLLLPLAFACNKQKCVTCIAETPSGKIVNNAIECDKSTDFLNGFMNGFRNEYKQNGDTMNVLCAFDRE